MSIIFPSEVLPSVDWTNPDTDGLLTCQYDDGTIVTDLLTGTTGGVFTVANLIGIAGSGGERVSATWTSKPAGIDTNPFSLLQTQEDLNQEYGLKWGSETDDQGIAVTGLATGEKHYVLTVGSDAPSSVSGYVYMHDPRWAGGTGAGFYHLGATTVAQPPSIQNVLLNGVVPTNNYDIFYPKAGDVISFTDTAEGDRAIVGGREAVGRSFAGLHLKSLQITDDNGLHYFDLNQTSGDTVTSKTSGMVATLVNFPADSGYVRGADDELVGYTITPSTKLSFTPIICTGDFSCGVTFTPEVCVGNSMLLQAGGISGVTGFGLYLESSNKIRVYFNGVRTINTMNHVFIAGVKATIEVTRVGSLVTAIIDGVPYGTTGVADPATLQPEIQRFNYQYTANTVVLHDFYVDNNGDRFNWDATTGNPDQIIETLNNNHATILAASTVKWQPFIPVESYTLGVGKDYDGISTFQLANKTKPNRQRALVYDTLGDVGTAYFYSDNFLGGLDVWGADGLRWGIDTPYDLTSGAEISQSFHLYNTENAHVKGLRFALGMRPIGGGDGCLHEKLKLGTSFDIPAYATTIKDCSLPFSLGRNSTATTGVTTVSNCVIDGRIVQKGGTLHVKNSIFTGATDWLTAYSNVQACTLQNVVLENAVSTSKFTDLGGVENGTLDFTGAFVDEPSGDLRINQAWADTNLVGKGWNSSNIASTFYYGTPVTVDVNAAVNFVLPLYYGVATATTTKPITSAGLNFSLPAYTSALTVVTIQPTVNSALALALPSYNAAVTATTTKPITNAGITATLPSYQAAIVAGSDQPIYSAAFIVALPNYDSAVTATATKPITSAGITAALPSYQAVIAAGSVQPVRSAALVIALPNYDSTATATTTKPETNSSVLISLPAYKASILVGAALPTRNGVVTVGLPAYSITVTATVTKPVTNSSIVAQLPSYSASIQANTPTINVTAVIAITLPNYQAAIAALAPIADVSASATISLPAYQIIFNARTQEYAVTSNIINIISRANIIRVKG